jgi:HK97 gp10 family phage protein
MANSFSIKFDASGLSAELDKLGQDAAEAVRPAAQAGAQVLYDEVKVRVPVRTGTLSQSIYQVFSKDNSASKNAVYHISWNAKKAPHGHLVEFGTSRAPARPFLRPAYDAAVASALKAANERWIAETRKKMGVA